MQKLVYAIQAALIGITVASAAWAALSNTDYSTTLSTSAQNCVPADASRKTLFIENPAGATNNVCYSFSTTPVCGSAGTSVLLPGSADFWSSGDAPIGPLYCIGSGATTPVTIRSGK